MQTRTALQYMPQLDGLRAIAVLLVVCSHWFPASAYYLPIADIGVILFFVLSGFLITRILLREKNNGPTGRLIRQFFIRRILRIFPLYYAVLLVIWLLDLPDIRSDLPWFVSYLPNIFYYKLQAWKGLYSHFWTLGVEEQFYLIWPFLILYVPRKRLRKAMIAAILIGILTRFVSYQAGNPMGYLLMPGNLDAFGLGGLLAYQRTFRDRWLNVSPRSRQGLWIAHWGFLCVLFLFRESIWYNVFFRYVFAVISLYLILGGSRGWRGWGKMILENPLLVHLGKISYGLYIFHNFIPWTVRKIAAYFSFSVPSDFSPVNLLLCFILLLLSANLSWLLFERPINTLKRYFPYRAS